MDEEARIQILIKEKREREKRGEEEYKKTSREKLKKIACSKIRTTMIGALDIIEKALSLDEDDGSEAYAATRRLYEKIRQDILDKGNTQIRNLESEFEQYEVKWLRYTLNLRVKENGNES